MCCRWLLGLWEFATEEGEGSGGVTTQVAGWQKVHKHRNPKKKDKSDQILIFSKAVSLSVAQLLFLG